MANKNKHIILFRFSAMGDIAIAAPLVRAYALSNPGVQFTMVSSPVMEPLFRGVVNLSYYPADFKGRHKGLKGLFRLFLSLLKLNPTHIADLHNVTRTWILRTLFFFTFTPIHYLKKGRKEKRKLTRKKNKVLRQLTPMYKRYESVLLKAGFPRVDNLPENGEKWTSIASSGNEIENGKVIKIGIAPYAKHRAKAWPVERMEEVISVLADDPGIKIYLFGGGWKESSQLLAMEQKYSSVESVAGKYDLEKELEIIRELHMLISMDSANMHLASFAGTPVISIWGSTHPFAGFYGWNQPEENIIQSELECRPCSVYGNKKCYRGDYACLMNIEAADVLQRVENNIKKIRSGEQEKNKSL